MDRNHKILLGGMAVLLGVTVAGFGGLAAQKQKVQAVPYPVMVTETPAASASATPALTPKTFLRSSKVVVTPVVTSTRVR